MTTQPTTTPRRHLRDAATICPAVMRLSSGRVINRCERDAGHQGQHKDECAHWGNPSTPAVSSGSGGSRAQDGGAA